jgi:hypothetical protein
MQLLKKKKKKNFETLKFIVSLLLAWRCLDLTFFFSSPCFFSNLECCGALFVRLDKEHFSSLRDNEPFQRQQQPRHDSLGSLGAYNRVNPNLAKCGSPKERGLAMEIFIKMDLPQV